MPKIAKPARHMRRALAVLILGAIVGAWLVALPPAEAHFNSDDPPPTDLVWVDWATSNQRNQLAHDEPINWVMRIEAHNAMASIAYGHTFDPNQRYSITHMLHDGARIVSLDVHVLDGEIWFCHNEFCTDPVDEREPYLEIIEEIGNWIGAHHDEFIWIRLEFLPDKVQDAGMTAAKFNSDYLPKLENAIKTHLDRGQGYVYQPGSLEIGIIGTNSVTTDPRRTSSTDFAKARWPTLRELQAHGKRVMVTSQNVSDSSWIWSDGVVGGAVTFWPGAGNYRAVDVDFKSCTNPAGEHEFWTAHPRAWSSVSEARTFFQTIADKNGFITESDAADLARCNVSRIEMDFIGGQRFTDSVACLFWLGALCPNRDNRIAETVWSWKEGFFGGGVNGDFAYLNNELDWVTANANAGNQFHFACAVPRDGDPTTWSDAKGSTWKVTRAVGEWGEGDQVCGAEFPDLTFAVPVNGWQNEKLKAALAEAMNDSTFDSSNSFVWLKYRRESTGKWVRDALPSISSFSQSHSPDGTVELTTVINNPDNHNLFMDWSIDGGAWSITSNDIDPVPDAAFSGVTKLEQDGVVTYSFSTAFSVGAHKIDAALWYNANPACTTCYTPVESRAVEFELSSTNSPPNLPVIASVLQADLVPTGTGVNLLNMDVVFTDPDDTDWQVKVNYGDGGPAAEQTRPETLDPESGLVSFKLDYGYANAGIFEVEIVVTEVRDGTLQGSSTTSFVVFNVTPEEEPAFIGSASGCNTTALFVGAVLECSIVFQDINTDTDTFEARVDFGDGSTVLEIGPDDISEVDDRAHLHVFFIEHRYLLPGTFDVTISVTDDGDQPAADKVYVTRTFSIQVTPNNTAPTVEVLGPDVTIAPGDTFSRTFTIVDPDAGDTFSGLVRYEPSLAAEAIDISTDGTFTLSHTYGQPGVFPLVFSLSSHYLGPSGPAQETTVGITINITVATPNTAPLLNAGGDAAVYEGEIYTQNVTFTDPDDDTWVAFVNYGDGTGIEAPPVDQSDKTFQLEHSFASEGIYQVGVALNDGQETATALLTITVLNAPPAVNAGPDVAIIEGDTFTSSGVFVDASPSDAHTATVDYGDDAGKRPLALDLDGTFSLNHRYPPDDGTYTVTVCVSDSNSEGCDDLTVTVLNAAPIVEAVTDQTVDEGSEVILDVATYSDPGTLDTHTATIEWGDGTVANAEVTQGAGSGSVAATHTYLDDGVYTVSVCVSDNDGGTGCDSFQVVVNGVAPTITTIIAPVDPIQIGVEIAVHAPFTDPGVLDTHTATVDWGDGATTDGAVTETNGSGTAVGTHVYTEPGVYTIAITVTDNGGEAAMTVYRYLVVYDPAGGFVTGGGWIESPEKAYVLDPTVAGPANFGFVAKYKKGQSTPDGNTHFQFHAADLNFKSTSYDWLVVAGARAMFKGVGTLDDEGTYGFILTAIDSAVNGGGSVDRFRIKIWEIYPDGSDGQIVYDNQLGEEDEGDASTPIEGGSIVIHDGKASR